MAFLFHFWRMKVCFNGDFYSSGEALLTSQNRSFKWGDGVFETMKVFEGRLLLEKFHFERLFISLQLLQIKTLPDFTVKNLVQNIIALCTENTCINSARVRMAVYRDKDNSAGYVIEAEPLPESTNSWQQDGLAITLYPYARKSMDAFSNIKSANFLPYVLAKNYADETGMDDALVLNGNNHICDSSRANIFVVKGGEILTPPLFEGCINGVMRRVVIGEVKKMGYKLSFHEIGEEQLWNADEIFLTNAIQIVRWVKQYKSANYTFTETKKIFEAVASMCLSGRINK